VINLKKIFLTFLFAVFFFNYVYADIKDSIFATVGNKAVVKSDILEEIKIILILNGLSYSQANKEQIEAVAIKTVIKRKIKMTEIEKYNYSNFSEQELFGTLNNYAAALNIDLETLENIFETNRIDFAKIKERTIIELLWNGLIFELYKDKLSINKEEIDEQLKVIQDKKEIEEFLVSEIIIKPVPENEIDSKIKEIKEMIDSTSFEDVARNLSISETAMRGGNLGWLNENVISQRFKSKIINTKVGNISDPIILPEGILLFTVREKRKIEKFDSLEDAKNQLVNAEKTKILNMFSLTHYDAVKRSVPVKYY